jgi:hypothetical protein
MSGWEIIKQTLVKEYIYFSATFNPQQNKLH